MEGEDGEEWRKLPCEDRIAHKVAFCYNPLRRIWTTMLFRCGRLG